MNPAKAGKFAALTPRIGSRRDRTEFLTVGHGLLVASSGHAS